MRQDNQLMRFFHTLSFKGTLILSVLLLTFSFIIYFSIKKDIVKNSLIDTEKLALQTGSSTINQLLTAIAETEALADSQASVLHGLDNTPQAYKAALSNNLDIHQYSKLLGSGYWTAKDSVIGDNTQAFFWRYNAFNLLEYDDRYESDSSHLSKEWFTIADYAPRGKCAWSRFYADDISGKKKITCAVAVKEKQQLKGVVSVDVDLSELEYLTKQAAQLTGGYVFFLDKDDRFITFANVDTGKKSIIVDGVNDLSQFSRLHKDFSLIDSASKAFNNAVIYNAKHLLGNEFDKLVNRLLRQSEGATSQAIMLDIARLYEESTRQFYHQTSTRFATINLANDSIDEEPARAYLFHVPKIYWKMGIVIPNSKATALAKHLSMQLLIFLLTLTVVLGAGSYFLLEVGILHPIRRVANCTSEVAELVHEKKYLALNDKKLPSRGRDETGMMSRSVNALIERIVENEGALAMINETLEAQVKRRTEELASALKDLKASQTQLIQAEKMSMLGQMVAGVTHEVNTPLGYLKSNIVICQELLEHYQELLGLNSVLKTHLSEDAQDSQFINDTLEQIKKTVSEIKEEAIDEEIRELFGDTLFGVEQISELVVELNNFARLDESQLKTVDIHECIQSAERISRPHLGDTEVIENFDRSLPHIYCSPSQINQVLLNLFNNATRATQEKTYKKIEITTSQCDNYAVIRMQDNGVGISEAMKGKIFEPFFTTEGAGEGTGLGLAICKQIIEEHKGKIEVTSTLGEGSCFSIYLPIQSEQDETVDSE